MKKQIIPETIEIQCQDCPTVFRWFPNSTIKPIRCKMCENKRLLAQSSMYSKGNSKPARKVSSVNSIKNAPKKAKTGNIDKQLDTAWSLLVKMKAGYKCIKCGKRKSLNSHHIYSRSNKGVRWYVQNGICLCVNHHIGVDFSAHKTPNDFTFWLVEVFGRKFIDDLSIRAKSTVHYSQFEKKIILKELQEEIKKFEI